MSLHSGADGSVTVGGAGVGAGGITGGSEMETVSGAWMVAATSAGELSTAAPAKPLEVAASFTASMMADANVVADAPARGDVGQGGAHAVAAVAAGDHVLDRERCARLQAAVVPRRGDNREA